MMKTTSNKNDNKLIRYVPIVIGDEVLQLVDHFGMESHHVPLQHRTQSADQWFHDAFRLVIAPWHVSAGEVDVPGILV